MMLPNLRSMIAQGGTWVVSRRSFSSSPSSVESKGEQVVRKLITASRVLVGFTSLAAGYGLGAVVFGDGGDVLGDIFFGDIKEAVRRKEEREAKMRSFQKS